MQPHILLLVLALPALCASDDSLPRCGKPGVAPSEAESSKEAVPHSWPWLVTIRLNGSHHCGGSIVNETWVATAAECVKLSEVSLHSVEAGRHCRDCDEATVQRRHVDKILIHPDFDTNYTEHDLALLRVSEPFLFNENVSQICLPQLPVPDNATCFVAGWGNTGSPREQVLQVRLPIVPNLVCGDPDHYGSGGISRHMLCAGLGGGNFCIGDYGGPLACKSEGSELWYLHGVMSAGDSCDRPLRPLVFTRVQEYLHWILVDGITLSS